MTALTRWRALGTTVEVVVADPADLFRARAAVERELAAVDRACSRFRPDSELSRVNAAAGRGPSAAGPLLREALELALDAHGRTGGAVDPTLGAAMAAAGYDCDLAAVPADGPALEAVPAPGVAGIGVDHGVGTVSLPAGVALDLGATAKAWAADRAARAAGRALRSSTAGAVLVSLGGDVAVAGTAPRGGWAVGIADDHRDRAPQHVVAVERGGVATSGLTARAWRRGGRTVHHVLDPRTGAPVDAVWRTVSVAAPSCVAANAWTTAALVLGPDAPAALRGAGVSARLVALDGAVVLLGGWPADAAARAPGDRVATGDRCPTRPAAGPAAASDRGKRAA